MKNRPMKLPFTKIENWEILTTQEKTSVECLECGHKFTKKLGTKTYEVKCPKCSSVDVEIV